MDNKSNNYIYVKNTQHNHIPTNSLHHEMDLPHTFKNTLQHPLYSNSMYTQIHMHQIFHNNNTKSLEWGASNYTMFHPTPSTSSLKSSQIYENKNTPQNFKIEPSHHDNLMKISHIFLKFSKNDHYTTTPLIPTLRPLLYPSIRNCTHLSIEQFLTKDG